MDPLEQQTAIRQGWHDFLELARGSGAGDHIFLETVSSLLAHQLAQQPDSAAAEWIYSLHARALQLRSPIDMIERAQPGR